MTQNSMPLLVALLLAGCASPPDSVTAPSVYYNEAREKYEAGNYAEAESLIGNSLLRDPRDASAHALLGLISWRQGHSDQAIVGFEQSLALDGSNAQVLYNLGTLYLERGENLNAAQLLERACSIDSDHAPVYNNLGKAYFMLGLPDLAAASFEKALELNPDSDSARHNLDALLAAEAQVRGAEASRPGGTR